MVRFLTQSEARDLFLNEAATCRPIARINERGKGAINEWLKIYGIPNVNLESFYADAENEAYAVLTGKEGVIKLPVLLSKDNYPQAVILDATCIAYFDWVL